MKFPENYATPSCNPCQGETWYFNGCGNQYPIVPATNPALVTWNGQQFVVADGSAQNKISLPFLQVNGGSATYVVGADNNGSWSYYSPNLNLSGGSAGQVPWQISTNVTGFTTTGTNGQLLQSGATSSPTWIAPNNLLVTSTGSTTARTLNSRFADVINVHDFGAVGDGTTDDTAAIQAAINKAISLGNAVVEFKPLRYKLATYQSDSNGDGLSNYLNIYGGSTSMRLLFRGNGATLFDTRTPAQISLVFVMSYFENIVFDDLNFSREGGISSIWSDNFANGIKVTDIDSTPVGDFEITNCTFNNCHHAIHIQNTVLFNRDGKFRSLNVLNCNFLYPYGSNCASPNGGGVIIFNGEWIETARYTNCYADGMVGGKIVTGVNSPKDGFLNVSPLNSIISGCTFKNFGIEGIIGAFTNGNIAINQFTQVAEGSDTTDITINSMQSGEGLITQSQATANGNIQQSWYVITSNWAAGTRGGAFTTGLYQLKSWSGSSSAGTALVFTRLPDALLGIFPTSYSPVAASTTVQNTGYGNRLLPFSIVEKYSMTITGNKFIGGPILNTDGSIYCMAHRPAISTVIETNITDNQFINCSSGITAGSKDIICKPTIVSNNYFFKNFNYLSYTIDGSAVYFLGQYCVASNNLFLSFGSQNYLQCLVQENNTTFAGNTFLISNPTVGTYSTSAITYSNHTPPYQVISNNNIISGYDYFSYGQNGNLIDGFNGKELSDNQRVKIKNRRATKQLTKNGWVRLNSNLTGFPATAGTIECDRVKFEVVQEGYSSGDINVIRNPYNLWYKSIDTIRLSSSYGICYIDVRVADYNKIATFGNQTLNVRASSESGDTNIADPVESTVITGIQNNGTNSVLITTSSSHGISTGDYVSITGSNSTPSIDGVSQATYVSPTTFTIAGYTITTAGNSQTISSYTGSGSTSTVTTAAAHNFSVGMDVIISGSTSSNIDGIFTISAVTSNTFTITGAGGSGIAGSVTCAELFNQKTQNISVSKKLKLASNMVAQSTTGIGDISGSGTPSSVPVFFGQGYYDTTNNHWYKAKGTSSSSDWIAIS